MRTISTPGRRDCPANAPASQAGRLRSLDRRGLTMRAGSLCHRVRRGSALLISLALVMAMTLLVAAVQRMVVSQLAVSKAERDYERALQMAESGISAYLNRLANGNPAAPPSWWPSFYTFNGIPTIAQF